MAETRAGYDEDLPWLEAVDDEDAPPAVSARKMIAFIAVVLIALAAVAGTMFFVGRDAGPIGGEPELIAAPEGPYKVQPDDPGGLDVAGDSETAYATSAGEETYSEIDTAAVEETPVIAVEPTPAPPPPVATQPAETPAETAAPAGVLVQLGAYTSARQAEAAWVLLSSRFPEVAALDKYVPTARVNGRLYHRLRAAAPDRATAIAACDAVKAGGESCVLVN
ncbi:MAG: SPOR domain-containing protein [Sphingomonas sp.]|nr:SPOR domain-containing protein [Sphingomonas sp.]RZV49863.1 MAG: hypothetical protein EX258_06465 [Sphingomonadaceae bacterium]